MPITYKDIEEEWCINYCSFVEKYIDKFIISDGDHEYYSPVRVGESYEGRYFSPFVDYITWDIIKNNPDKPWNWDSIPRNTMEKGRDKWINDYRLRIIKALQIQKHWRYYSCNPEFKLAQKLLLRLHGS